MKRGWVDYPRTFQTGSEHRTKLSPSGGGGGSELKMGDVNETFTQQNITWDLTRRSRKSCLFSPPEMSHEGYYENDISVRWCLPKDSAAFITTTFCVSGNIAFVFVNPWTSCLGDVWSCLIQTGMILWTIYVAELLIISQCLDLVTQSGNLFPIPFFF